MAGTKGTRGRAKLHVVPPKRQIGAKLRTWFDYAGIGGLTKHDLQHETACRLLELRDDAGQCALSNVEIACIMGWTHLRMALRYASLHGDNLAARLRWFVITLADEFSWPLCCTK